MGTFTILQSGKGDHRITIENDEDVASLGPQVQDLLKRGYLITLQGPEGQTDKVTGFDGRKGTYLVSGGPEQSAKDAQGTAMPPVGGG